jgi:hypothetical protein
MSVVTNTILACDCTFYFDDLLEHVNSGISRGDFISVSDKKLPDGWYGGTKYLECRLAIAAFNHLDFEELIHHLWYIDFSRLYDCRWVQLLIEHQDFDGFGIIEIYRDEYCDPPFSLKEYCRYNY